MTHRVVLAVVAALAIGAATTAFSFRQASEVGVAIDTDPTGNTGNEIGSIEACRQVAVGDTFDVDIVVLGVPVPEPADEARITGGIAGYGYNLHFDPAVVHVNAAVQDLMLASSQPFSYIAGNYDPNAPANPLPGTSGNTRIDYLDLSPDVESGDGVLTRLTLEAVGEGSTTLALENDVQAQPAPVIYYFDGTTYGISSRQDAIISVGAPCESEPTPFDPEDTYVVDTEQATPVPTGEASPGTTSSPAGTAPAGDTELAVDAITSGNGPTEVGTIDTCGAADVGESFAVDIVIRGVTNLLGWELPVSYDPEVLRVDGRDVRMFQAANEGSDVFDASNQTPDSSGIYMAGAVDQADPVSPDSGDGVLVRLTFTAVAEGTSGISLDPIDINDDGAVDRGILLRNVDAALIGDEDGDTFFDGPAANAEIRVGEACDDGGRVEPADAADGQVDEDDGDDSWVWIAGGAAAAGFVILAGAGYLLLRGRRRQAS